jgi:peptide chain release factor subunit 3
MPRQKDAPLRIPVLDKFKDMGQVNVMGKVETGRVRLGQTVMFQPGGGKAEVIALANDMADLNIAECGENIRLVIKGVEEEHIHKGFVVCEPSSPIPVATEFVAQLTCVSMNRASPCIPYI